jgi:membrane protease YdiL (CAAX protease family)
MRPVAIAFVALSVLGTAATSYFAFLPQSSGTVAFWVLAGAPQLLLAAVAAYWANREELLRAWIGPRWGDFSRGVAAAGVLFGIAWAGSRVVAPVGSSCAKWLQRFYDQIGDAQLLRDHGPAVAASIAAVAIAEELVWRGMVTQLIADRVGTRTAWVWAAVLYAVAYAPTAWSLRAGAGLNPIVPAAALGAGLLWGAMARIFGRLAPGIIAHAFFDWVVLMFPLKDH